MHLWAQSFRALFKIKSRTAPKRSVNVQRLLALRMEQLEDRVVPTSIVWNGPAAGNFTTGANWSGGSAPGINDIAVFDSTNTNSCTIDTAIDVAGILIQVGYTGTITDPASANTITLETNGYSQASGSFLNTGGAEITVKDTTMTTLGNFIITGGTFNAGGGTVDFAAPSPSTQSINSGGQSFANITHNGSGTLQLESNSLTVTGSFLNNAGFFDLNGLDWSMNGLAGNFSNPGEVYLRGTETITGLTQDATEGKWTYYGNSTMSTIVLKDFGATDYNQLVLNGTNTFQAVDALNLKDFFFFNNGKYDSNGFVTTVGGVTSLFGGGTYLPSTAAQNLNGGLTVSGGTFTGSTGTVSTSAVNMSSGTLTAPTTLNVSADFNITGGTFTPGGGTVNFTSASTQHLNSDMQNFGKITHSGTGTLQLLTSPLTVTTNFTNSAGIFDLNGLAWTMSGGATFSNPGTIRLRGTEAITGLTQDATEGTWQYVGDNTGGMITLKNFGTPDYFNLVINDSNVTKDTFKPVTALNVAGAFTVTNGTYDANGQTTTVTGLTRVNAGTYLASTAAQNFNGGLTISSGFFTGSTGPVTTPTFSFSGGTFTAPNSLTLSGDFLHTGGAFNGATGTVFFTGTGTQALTGDNPFFNLVHSGTGTVRTNGGTDSVLGDFTSSAGTFDANGSKITFTGLALIDGSTYLASTAEQTFMGGLTLTNTATLGIQFAGTDADQFGHIIVSGGDTNYGDATLVVDLNGFTPPPSIFDLITNEGLGIGQFVNAPPADVFITIDGIPYAPSYGGGVGGNDFVLVPLVEGGGGGGGGGIDTIKPTVIISPPSAPIAAGGPITYTVTYTDANFNGSTLLASNVMLNKTGTAFGTVSVSPGSGSTRTVTISNITGDGTLGISLAAGTANDRVGNQAPAAGPSATFTVDTTAPTVSISPPSASTSTGGPIIYTILYSDTNFNTSTLTAADITLNKTGTAKGTISVSPGSGTTRTVTISNITGAGTLGVTLAAGTASDTAGNLAPAAGPSGTFNVVNLTPTLTTLAVGGSNGTVRLLRETGTLITTVTPISGYTGLVSVALGDFNSDTVPDLAVAAANPAGQFGLTTSQAGKVFVYDGAALAKDTLTLIHTFTPFTNHDGPDGGNGIYTNGLNIAAGDIDGDGHVDLIAGTRGGSATAGQAEFGRLVVLEGVSDTIIGGIQTPFGSGYQKGVIVAAGNVDGAGGDEIAVTRGGPVASPDPAVQTIKVKVLQLQGTSLTELHLAADGSTAFAPFAGLTVAAKGINRDGRVAFVDSDGDGKADLVFTALDPLTNKANEQVRVGVYSINVGASSGAATIVSTGTDAGTYLTGHAVQDHAITHAAATGTQQNLALLTESASSGIVYLAPLTGAVQTGGFSLTVLHGGITIDGI